MKLDRNSNHLAGEYFVAAELYRRGYSVGMTIGNAKAVDLIVERKGKAQAIQVKTIQDKYSAGWPMWKEDVKSGVLYVFVCLNAPDVRPDYYVCTSREAKSKVCEGRTRGIVSLSDLMHERYRDRWDKVRNAMT